MNQAIKNPGAWIPIVMSLAALALLLGCIAVFGVIHETDEGAAAHIFQLLMALQVPVITFFAIKWLPQSPKNALLILALQFGVALLPMTALFFLEL